MAASQAILVTVVPRGVAVDTETLPISLFITPRLRGADRLGAFPDWQLWTERVHYQSYLCQENATVDFGPITCPF